MTAIVSIIRHGEEECKTNKKLHFFINPNIVSDHEDLKNLGVESEPQDILKIYSTITTSRYFKNIFNNHSIYRLNRGS